MLVKRSHEAHRAGNETTEFATAEAARIGPDQSALRDVTKEPQAVAWAYAGLDNLGEDERDTRRRSLLDRIAEQGAPVAAVEAVRARLEATREGPLTLALFVAGDGTLLHEQLTPRTGPVDEAGWGAPPPLLPLLARLQERPPFVLVVIDRVGADLWSSPGGDSAVRIETVLGPDDEIQRNAPGGWQGLTQGRYQHRAEDSWMHNARHVASAAVARVAEVGAQVLILSGDVRAVQFLTDALPPLPGVLVRRISGSRSADGSQSGRRERVEEELRAAAADQTRLVLDLLRENLEPGGLGVAGWSDTVDALAAGRVAALLVADGMRADGPRADGVRAEAAPGARTVWFGAGATDVFRDHDAAALTGRPVEAGNLVDVAVRAALLSGARVRVVTGDDAAELPDGLGAVCRFGGT